MHHARGQAPPSQAVPTPLELEPSGSRNATSSETCCDRTEADMFETFRVRGKSARLSEGKLN